MSYRNPQYKVISQAQNYKDMINSIANAAGDIATARAEVAEENKKREDAKIEHRILTNTNYSKEVNESGAKKYEVFNKTLDGLDLEYEKYSMNIFNKDCGENDPGCKNAIANQQFLIDLPDELVGQAATWQEQVDNILENKNVDPNDPMYNKLVSISKILGKTPGYNGNMEVVPTMDKETGQYTGTTWKFTGPGFGDDGFEMTNAELERLTEGDKNIVADSPEYWDQSNRINQASGLFKGPPGMDPKKLFNDNGTPANGVTLSKDFQLKNKEGQYITSDDTLRTINVPYTHDGKTYYREYEYNVVPWNVDGEGGLMETARPTIHAEADAMLDVSDPKDAIAFWNNNLKGKYTKDMGDYNGVLPYQNMNAKGDKNLIYDMNKNSPTYGEINPEFKKHFYKAYEQYYYDNTLKPFVDQEIMNPDVQERASDNCYDQNGKKTKCHTASSSITFKFNPGTNIGGTS